jgi:hypothetical protein
VEETFESPKLIWEFISQHVTREDRWTWTESALIVPQVGELSSKWSDFSIEIPGLTDQPGFNPEVELHEVFELVRIRFCLYGFPGTVRGEEFQDVLVSLPKRLWQQMNRGKSGLAANEWSQIMPLHVYTTRGKDTVRILVTDEIPF